MQSVMRKALVLLLAVSLIVCLAPIKEGAGVVVQQDVSGYALDNNGDPLIGVIVQAINTTTFITYTEMTNATGAYRFSLPSGTYSLTASLDNYTTDVDYGPIEIPQTNLVPFNFTLTEILCSIAGFVTDGSQPVYGVEVTLSNADFNYTTTTIKPLGSFEIKGIQPGVYVAYAEKRGYNPAGITEPIILERGDTHKLNFTLEKQAASIYGTVYGENSNALEGVKVTLSPTDSSAASVVITDSNGNFTISDVPVGDYTITFEKDNYHSNQQNVAFGPYENKRLDVSLTRTTKNTTAILFGYDLTHSMMIIGFGVGLVMVLFGIVICLRVLKKPEILAKIETEDEPKNEG